jgi:hypothetical protein
MLGLSGRFGWVDLPKPKVNLAFRIPEVEDYIQNHPLYFTGKLQI